MDSRLHFRRCHVCQQVTESRSSISHCGYCRKPMAAFQFFDDEKVEILADNQLRPELRWQNPQPVRGLTAHW